MVEANLLSYDRGLDGLYPELTKGTTQMILKFYIIATLLTLSDEIWNIKHPRPYSFKSYYLLQWEEKDFYSKKINNEWVLRKYRKTDTTLKRRVRTKYWKKRLNFKK